MPFGVKTSYKKKDRTTQKKHTGFYSDDELSKAKKFKKHRPKKLA